MLTRAQTLILVFVVALVAAAFFGLVLDTGPFVSGALAGIAAVLVLGAVQRHRLRTTASRDPSVPGPRR
ncbi:MAG TPA: hypothetical protein VLK58_11995 [Conexibacter sp.]|nr:hypothetical protein [Conexibacter sp.]